MDFISEIAIWGGRITFIDIIDFIGTFAFAISGIRLASAKQFDWFGAYVVGAATAIGGGTIRDIMLDVPLFWMHDPFYLICTGLALLWVIIFRKHLIRGKVNVYICLPALVLPIVGLTSRLEQNVFF